MKGHFFLRIGQFPGKDGRVLLDKQRHVVWNDHVLLDILRYCLDNCLVFFLPANCTPPLSPL